jgi:hypothetical protein
VGMMSSGQLHLEAGLDELQAECRRIQVVFESGQVPADFAPAGTLRAHSRDGIWSGVVRAPAQALDALQATPGAGVQLFPLGLEDLFVELFSREEMA